MKCQRIFDFNFDYIDQIECNGMMFDMNLNKIFMYGGSSDTGVLMAPKTIEKVSQVWWMVLV